MRFLFLTPGTGHFYCGSCLRDHALETALRRAGHEVSIVPLYLPLVLEEDDPSVGRAAVRLGGINMYLQQKSGLARFLPRFVHDLLDRPGILRWASRHGHYTEAPDLGPMTVSMLRGEHGRQAGELEVLVGSLRHEARPDVVVLSNAMLTGIVRRVKAALGCPVVVTLQGEAPFLDTLPAPFAEQAWGVLVENARDVDRFVPVSETYGALMRDRLGLSEDRLRVVHNGLELRDFSAAPPRLAARRPRTIGYLARMCRDKGLPTLVDAFVALRARPEFHDVRLSVAGVQLEEDRPLVRDLQQRLDAAGSHDHVEFRPNISRSEKLAFLRSLAVLSVPATYGESFGLYLLEAMAAGVPVVQPRSGAFPEILEATGGGVLCAPDDPAALAVGLADLLADEVRAQGLADAGRAAVLQRFEAGQMAARFVDACADLASA